VVGGLQVAITTKNLRKCGWECFFAGFLEGEGIGGDERGRGSRDEEEFVLFFLLI